ncbi:MAG: aldehyde dehydrogenase family protein [Chloroflexi bacterium]|nr:aldehyde dehydrogenase family protein [Chloroflexota bacterium]
MAQELKNQIIDVPALLSRLGIGEINNGAYCGSWLETGGEILESISPIDGKVIAKVRQATVEDYEKVASQAEEAFKEWKTIPAPRRGEIVRRIGDALRKHKKDLGALVTLEMGKILAEGEGEVQEMIDICDFSVGLSRQLYGMTTQSERPSHRMFEQWHPMGMIGIVTAFNFPVAVWAWNAALAMVCGDTMIWKPASKVPLTAIACINIIHPILEEMNVPKGVSSLVIGPGKTVGDTMINDKRIKMVSFTGSCKMGKRVGKVVGERLGKTILELGGNNCIIVTPSANMEMVVPAILFGSVGTAGQRCTTTRRILAQNGIFDDLKNKLVKAYKQVRIGNPLSGNTLMGPVVDKGAIEDMQNALKEAEKEGGKILCGGEVLTGEGFESGCYITPAIVEAKNEFKIVQEETFAPILYLIRYDTIDDAIRKHNDVPQGLSSAIFTRDLLESEYFLSNSGSDCGIANVNIGTSGAEIGGAFGGEKETGGGRESGSDAWKGYMRRQTNTINWSKELPLAQGIKFEL